MVFYIINATFWIHLYIKKYMIITIDGFAGTWKWTTALWVAHALWYTYLDTWAMYRALTYYFLSHNKKYTDPDTVVDVLWRIYLYFERHDDGTDHIRVIDNKNTDNKNTNNKLSKRDYTDNIRSLEVGQHVSHVANTPLIRPRMVQQQQDIWKHGNIVVDGRDWGTVLFPDADLKIYITCDLDIRAGRRHQQQVAAGKDYTFDQVKQELASRDAIDRQHTDLLLQKYPGQVKVLDTSHISMEEQISQVVEWVG